MAQLEKDPDQHMVRVFAAAGQPAGGNPAPVWLGADGLDTADMQARAHASGHESVFVLAPADATHGFRMRYFVPKHEMEMCGHATIGALWLLRERGAWDGSPTSVETLSGIVRGQWAGGMVAISQPRGLVQALPETDLQRIAQCLNIAPAQIAGPVLNAATSRVKTLIQLRDPETLHALQINFAQVESLCEAIGSTGLYPFARRPGEPATASARQFPKSSGYPEDAATGIAAAALAWGLRARQLVVDDAVQVCVHQGEAMGSPSTIWVGLPAANAEEDVCWLRGAAVAMEVGHAGG